MRVEKERGVWVVKRGKEMGQRGRGTRTGGNNMGARPWYHNASNKSARARERATGNDF